MEITMTALAQEIARCWELAEKSVAQLIAYKYCNPDEEFITRLLAGELKDFARRASSERRFEQALLTDLSFIPEVLQANPTLADGLIARVTFHNKQHEGKRSGADFGLIIRQPRITVYLDNAEIEQGSTRALLAQAKRRTDDNNASGDSSWGKLTISQTVRLKEHQGYSALVLYRIVKDRDAAMLPLRWHLCSGYTIHEVERWLDSGEFPLGHSSTDVISGLSTGQVGTASAEVIKNVIDPERGAFEVIEIDVSWRDDPPPPWVHINRESERQVIELSQDFGCTDSSSSYFDNNQVLRTTR